MKTFLSIILLSISITITAQQTVDLFIWAGQSNALGRQGDAAQYPADPDGLDSQILFNWTVPNGSNSGGWTTMGPQDLGHYFPAGHFGPEVTFSRKLKQAGYNPAVFKYTQGATSIFEHWLNPGQGGLYDNMVTALNTAITNLENQGYTVNVRGFIWIQGESDSNSDAAANAYPANLPMLINDFRNNVLNLPELPTIFGVDEQFFNLTGHERHQILNTHQDIVTNDDNIKFTSMYGYPKADLTHLTPAGVIAHGEDLFDSFQLLLSGAQPTANCTLTSVGNHDSFARTAWGQSFNTACSGMLSNITFEAISQLASSATFTLYHGADCSSTVLATKSLNSIEIGDNTIDLASEQLYIDGEHSYYFEIVSDNGATWSVNFNDHANDTDTIYGVLRCTADNDPAATCGRTFLDYDLGFSVTLSERTSCNIYSSGSNVSFERTSWGQTFSPSCSDVISSVTFSAASELNSASTFTLYDGTDCSATALYTKPISAITIGNNTVDIDNPITLSAGNTYYFQIASDDTTPWRIDYSNTSIVTGNLVCTSDDGSSVCGRTFPSFDMNFSLAIGESECTNISNLYAFDYDGRTYHVIKDVKNWADAAACAAERGGQLARINDAAEQAAIWTELANANIDLTTTVAINGGGASYIWIGGNDLAAEGTWIWDGNNDGTGDQFWNGDTNGNAVGGLYSNWGNEPDDAGNQDCLGIALTQWPINSGSLGSAGEWNDLKAENLLCYLIEYPTLLNVAETAEEVVTVYPNPVNNTLNINAGHNVTEITLVNIQGQVIKNIKASNITTVDVADLKKGIYILQLHLENNNIVSKKIIK